MPETPFTLTTLGELRLDGPGGSVLPGRRKELVLLAFLARRAPRSVTRDELASLLWGERDEEKARQSLRQALHQLRQALGPAIEVTTEQVRVAETGLMLDATLMEQDIAAGRLVEGVARWNGQFLRGAEDAGDDSYRAWLERERETLRRSVVSAFVKLVDQARAEGRVDQEAHWARCWAEQFPLDEDAQVRLMEALLRSGDVAGARSNHAAFLARLKNELDVPPSRDLLRLGEYFAQLAAKETRRQSGSGALHAPALSGRGAAIATSLTETVSRLRNEGAAIVLEGDEGFGKTRLCAELIRRAGSGKPPCLILHASGAQIASTAGYSAIRRLFESVIHAPVLEEVPNRALVEFADTVPALRERFPQLGAPSGQLNRLEGAFRELARAVGMRAPVLLILDDAERADAASLQLIRTLAASPPQGVMVLISLRADDSTGAAIARQFGELPGVRRFKLAPLSREDIGVLLDSMIDVTPEARQPLIDRLLNESGGNPASATALVSAMSDTGALELNAGGVWQLGPGFKAAGPSLIDDRPAGTSNADAPASSIPDASKRVPTVVSRPAVRSRKWIAVAVASLVALAFIPYARQLLRGPTVNATGTPRIAVLDLEVATRDSLDAHLGVGLVEEINAQLARVEGLRLKSRSVVRTAQTKGATDPVQLGNALHVDYLVEGLLRRVGTRRMVSIRLTKASDGFQVWGDDFDADTALPQLHERIAREVASRVGFRLASASTPRPVTSDAVAYEHFLRGNYYLARRTPPTVQQAIAQYRAAVSRDTNFAAARARIAYGYAVLLDWGWPHDARSNDDLFQEGLALAQRALESDSLSADAWMARAYLLATSDPVRMRGAAEAFERAIELDPRNVEAIHQYAQVHQALGNWDAAMSAFRQVLSLEPDRSLPYVSMASIAWKRGQPLTARRLYDSALVVDPGASYVLSARALLRLFALNDTTGGLEDAETAVRVSEGYSIPPHSVLAIALARSGSKTRAELEVERGLSELIDPASPSPTDARFLASALLAVGRREDALSMLERVRPRGAWVWFYFLSQDFDAIRDDPRFVRVMADAHPVAR